MPRSLDRIDAHLVRRLQASGRISNKELAAEVGLAASSCLERVRRLREDGVITGTRALVDPGALGVALQAMVAIRLRSHDRAAWASLHDVLDARDEVVAVYHLSGADDLLVHVACRGTDHLRDLVMEAIASHDAVRGVETSLVFDHSSRPMPVYEG